MDDEEDDDNERDSEFFDVLFADDEETDNNAVATLEWLMWKFSIADREDGGGRTLIYGIPDWYMN